MAGIQSLTDEELQSLVEKGSSASAPPLPSPSNDITALSDAELEQLAKGANSESPKPSVIQEMHPAFTRADRFVIKNVSNNTEDAVNYLKNKHPDLEVTSDDSGQILARGKGETEFRVLDPDTGFFSAGLDENVRDISDSAYDLLAGGLTTAASAAGGLAGAPAGPAGALFGAGKAGALTSAGLEGLKQSLGKIAGVGDFSGSDLAIATGVGALSPLLGGTGASSSQLAKAGLTKTAGKGLQNSLHNIGVSLADDGLLGYGTRGIKAAAKGTAGFLSGVGKEVVDTYSKHSDLVESILKDPEGRLKFVEGAAQSIDEAFKVAEDNQQAIVKAGLGAAGDAPIVPSKSLRERLEDEIAASMKGPRTEPNRDKTAALQKILKDNFTEEVPVEEVVSTMKPHPSGLVDAAGNPLLVPSEDVVTKTVSRPVEAWTPEQAVRVGQEMADLANFQKLTPSGMVDARYNNQSPLGKDLMRMGTQLKKLLDNTLDAVVPSNVRPAMRKWGEIRNLEKMKDKILANPQAAFSNLKNADVNSRITKDVVNRIDRLAPGANLGEQAKIATTLETLGGGRASIFSVDNFKQRTPSAIIGGTLGYGAGLASGTPGVAPAAAAGGTLAGGVIGGPAMLKFALRRAFLPAAKGASKVNNALPVRPETMLGNAWLKMKLGDDDGKRKTPD